MVVIKTNNQPRFHGAFSGIFSLTGSIPAGLFAGISGAPVSYMFEKNFFNCGGLISVPEKLLGNISGPAQDRMFMHCTSLTGPSVRINGQYLYEIWLDATSSQVGDMYYNASKLSDYATMPTVWKQSRLH